MCNVEPLGNGHDDCENILAALRNCNNGGRVVLDKSYTIGTALDLQFLEHIDLDISGYIQFTNNVSYWTANAFQLVYQNATTFFQLAGHDVNIYGDGPVCTISTLNLRNSPSCFHIVANSSDVLFDNINISGESTSVNPAANTDRWDTYRSSNIVIQNSTANNDDDCVSFKPNSSEILVQKMHCNGSHGISVGSLGQYVGETDVNILVYNVSMYNASDGARIKVWPGVESELSLDLQGGGGTGIVQNITYDTFYVNSVEWAIQLTQ